MKLYGFPASPNTWKVRALASYLKMPLDFEFVDLTQGRPICAGLSRTQSDRAHADAQSTATSRCGNLMRSCNILRRRVATPLYPNDAKSRADITRWQCWDLAHWGAQACGPLTFENLVKKFVNLGAPDATAVAKATEAFNKEAKMLDAHLAKHNYLVDDMLTIADFSAAAPLFHAQGAGMPVGPYANIGAWFGRVSALPCWSETAPQMAAAA